MKSVGPGTNPDLPVTGCVTSDDSLLLSRSHIYWVKVTALIISQCSELNEVNIVQSDTVALMSYVRHTGSRLFILSFYVDIIKFKYYKNHLENSLRGFYLREEFSAFQIFCFYNMKMPLPIV